MAKRNIITLILLIVAVMFVVSVVMGAAAAAKEVKISSGSTNGAYYKQFINGNKSFSITVNNGEGIKTLEALNPGDVKKEIEGVNGIYNEKQSDLPIFSYISKDQKYIISISGDMDVIQEVLKLNK